MDISYAFPSDWKSVVRTADSQLVPAGWIKSSEGKDAYSSDNRAHAIEVVSYEEPAGQKRFVAIEGDCSTPTVEMSSDLLMSPTYRQGWVAVTVHSRPEPSNWKGRAVHWLHKIFLGRP